MIGRQQDTGFGGRIDLLAIAPDGALIPIELKRNKTPREVVAQAIDYASFVEELESDKIAKIYDNFAPGRNLKPISKPALDNRSMKKPSMTAIRSSS